MSRNSPSVPKLANKLLTELAHNSDSFLLRINTCERLSVEEADANLCREKNHVLHSIGATSS